MNIDNLIIAHSYSRAQKKTHKVEKIFQEGSVGVMNDKKNTENTDEVINLSENPISEILAQGQSSREEIRHSVEKGIDLIQRLLRQEARGREFIYITTKVLVSYPGVTQREIASELGISQAAVRDWAKRGNELLNAKAEQGKAQRAAR